jgi:hypothetical protein
VGILTAAFTKENISVVTCNKIACSSSYRLFRDLNDGQEYSWCSMETSNRATVIKTRQVVIKYTDKPTVISR